MKSFTFLQVGPARNGPEPEILSPHAGPQTYPETKARPSLVAVWRRRNAPKLAPGCEDPSQTPSPSLRVKRLRPSEVRQGRCAIKCHFALNRGFPMRGHALPGSRLCDILCSSPRHQDMQVRSVLACSNVIHLSDLLRTACVMSWKCQPGEFQAQLLPCLPKCSPGKFLWSRQAHGSHMP